MSFGVSVTGSTSGSSALGPLARASQQRVLIQAGRKLLAGVEHAFERQGPGWQPLADRTVEERRRLGFPPGPILQRRGGGGGFRTTFKGAIDGDNLQIVSDDIRFETLVEGRGNVPARPVIIPDEDQRAAARAAHDEAVGR